LRKDPHGNRASLAKVTFDPFKDFAPVATLTINPFLMAVQPFAGEHRQGQTALAIASRVAAGKLEPYWAPDVFWAER